MSIGRLGSYTEMLQALHQLLLAQAAPTPQPAPVAPQPQPLPLPSSLGRDTYVPSAPRDPNSFFMSQVRDARWNPNATQGNTNCGPTSLAMALRAIGLTPPGLTNPQNPEEWIDRTRYAMEGDTNDFKLTSDDDVLRGALASGAQAAKVCGVQGVQQAVQQGKMVVVAGNPTAYENRFSDSQYAHFNGGHFILVTGINGNQVTINDPQSHAGSMTISLQELQQYMGYQNWNVGVAVSR